MKTRKIKRYGWKPDKPDFRDYRYHEMLKPKEKPPTLPPSIDLRAVMPAIQDQGNLGSCTAHATVAAVERGRYIHDYPFHALSRLFIYYNARKVEGDPEQDNGASVRDAVAGTLNFGVPAEVIWPYDISKFAQQPSPALYDQAAKWKIRVYTRLNSLEDMLVCLASRHPFVFGFTVYDSFESDQVASTGIVNLPGPNESVLGGHAVCAVGYDMEAKRFLVRNSWGTDWGMAGHFTMPFDYLTNSNLADDFWTVRL
jgi:C1A family cysteine protease